MNADNNLDWKLGNLLADPQKLFVLWTARTGFCRTVPDFQKHYGPDFPIAEIIAELRQDGFLRQEGLEFESTQRGAEAIKYLNKKSRSASKVAAPLNDESDALAELRKLLMNISSAGTTNELAATVCNEAKYIYQKFSSSSSVTDLYERILRAARPVPGSEPEPCRALRENLTSTTATARTIIAALKASGFYRRSDIPLREVDCFCDVIHGPLQTLRASHETVESIPPDRLQAKLNSLHEVLEALPPNISYPRQVVEKIIHQLELQAARERFLKLLGRLEEQVEEQDFKSNPEHQEIQSNLWGVENPAAPEVIKAQAYFARLEELQRAFVAETADAERIRNLIESQQEYDQALNEIRLIDARLSETRVRDRGPLNSVLDNLLDKLAEIYKAEESAMAGTTPTEAMLEASLVKLGILNIRLQKVPDSHEAGAQSLYRKSTALTEDLTARLNTLRLHNAREELRHTEVAGVPAYLEALRASDLPELRDWVGRVYRVLEAMDHVSETHERPVDTIYLTRLENAVNELGPVPLAQAARAAAQEYRDNAVRDYLWAIKTLVDGIKNVELDLPNVTALGQAISTVVGHLLKYRQYRDSELFAETFKKYANEYESLDQEVLDRRRFKLPDAIQRWAKLVVGRNSSQDNIEAARNLFAGWHEVLGVDFPRTEIERAFNERSAEIEIRELMAAEKFDEAQQIIRDSGRLLSPTFIRDFKHLLGRRQAVAHYKPGHEAEIAAAIKEHGPDPELLEKLVDDFSANGQFDHLASIYQSLSQIELVDPRAALFVRWSSDFKLGALDPLAQSLIATKDAESVLLFARGLAHSPYHAAALRLLKLVLDESAGLRPETYKEIEAAYEILKGSFTEACERIQVELNELNALCKSNPSVDASDQLSDAQLQQKIEETISGAQAFLDKSIEKIDKWLEYLTTAGRFSLKYDRFLLTSVQDLEVLLRSNQQLLDRLVSARKAIQTQGWWKLEDLRKALSGSVTLRIPPVAAVVKLLNSYLRNDRRTIKFVSELTEAWDKDGEGLSSERLTYLVNSLNTGEFKYDFRADQDRFRQLTRLHGKTFPNFIDELKDKVTEIEAVRVYRQRLLNAMTGKEDLIRRRIEHGRRADHKEVADILQQPDSLGRSMLDLYRNQPDTSKSQVAEQHLRALEYTPWFALLKQAVRITENLKDKISTQDLLRDA